MQESGFHGQSKGKTELTEAKNKNKQKKDQKKGNKMSFFIHFRYLLYTSSCP